MLRSARGQQDFSRSGIARLPATGPGTPRRHPPFPCAKVPVAGGPRVPPQPSNVPRIDAAEEFWRTPCFAALERGNVTEEAERRPSRRNLTPSCGSGGAGHGLPAVATRAANERFRVL